MGAEGVGCGEAEVQRRTVERQRGRWRAFFPRRRVLSSKSQRARGANLVLDRTEQTHLATLPSQLVVLLLKFCDNFVPHFGVPGCARSLKLPLQFRDAAFKVDQPGSLFLDRKSVV